MSGKRVVIILAIGILATSTIMYTLYFLTRQLDYISPSEAPVEPAAPAVRLIDPTSTTFAAAWAALYIDVPQHL